MKSKLEGKTHLFMTTVKGTVKRTDLKEFENIRRSGLIAQKINEGDELKWVLPTSGKDEIFILTRQGKAIRFPEADVRSMGRSAAGVHGIRLQSGDQVVEAAIVGGSILNKDDDGDLICISKQGQAIRMKLSDIPSRGRATQGVIVMRLTGGDKVASMSVILIDPNAVAEVEAAAEEDKEE